MTIFWNLLIELSLLSLIAYVYYLYQKRRIATFYAKKRVSSLELLLDYLQEAKLDTHSKQLFEKCKQMQNDPECYFTKFELENICDQITDEDLLEKLHESFDYLIRN
ncbi:MAG: hypothetical protein JNM93_08300 [Bacteriovoracaceae bacterium]|nr:hypothetical protein [Bacteriovoracaceae bacterium]